MQYGAKVVLSKAAALRRWKHSKDSTAEEHEEQTVVDASRCRMLCVEVQ